ncbi:hypothetical protein Tco_0608301 [Tanacetum coccineum]
MLWGTNLDMSCVPSTYRRESGGHHSNFEDLCCVLVQRLWERVGLTICPLVEFYTNNSDQFSIKAAPFEALYGRKCRSPVCWTEVGEAQILGPELIQETTEKILVQAKMQADSVIGEELRV